MEELIEKISGDPMLMLSAAVAVVVLLFVVLVVVVASMRIKLYKDRYVNVRIDNQEKEKQISVLEETLQHPGNGCRRQKQSTLIPGRSWRRSRTFRRRQRVSLSISDRCMRRCRKSMRRLKCVWIPYRRRITNCV